MSAVSTFAHYSQAIVIRLDGVPIGKGRPRFSRATGAVHTPERTVRFEDRLSIKAQSVMAGRPLLSGPLYVEIVALMPVPASWPKKRQAAALAGLERPTKKPDYDNFAKVLDACNLIVWKDDSQIVHGDVQKFYSDRPCFAVRVTPAPAAGIPSWVEGEADVFA